MDIHIMCRYFQDQVEKVRKKNGGVISNAALVRMATTYRLINKIETFQDWNRGKNN
jgi:hypothetical protein